MCVKFSKLTYILAMTYFRDLPVRNWFAVTEFRDRNKILNMREIKG